MNRTNSDEELTSGESRNLVIQTLKPFIIFGSQFLGNYEPAKLRTVITALAGVHAPAEHIRLVLLD